MALPENLNLSAQNEPTQSTQPKTSDKPTMDDALKLWEREENEQALSIAQSVYESGDRARVGYRYGLLLEASARDSVEQHRFIRRLLSLSWRIICTTRRCGTLRRLDRLNESNGVNSIRNLM